ncbi:hypothetical protein M409DRAFT_52933 [Zasmidium cellare ATCC 36951]|uniref:GA4 desaturase n=1 Tax=Zasmidium cellare ATCC 36951 TaxID=1080233 RepID=A0A6A6CT51_ZASCE|nr:uncharacterized protein M409DRAFT_52933 [Zasmidium cellare ATCC 36951]KAF2168949.1 hypothetical protein M409DRAFT_52933 [Zasmidium cellare ATCC 36951]
MGDAGDSDVVHHGVIRYIVSAKDPPPEKRSLFGLAANSSWTDHELAVRDFRKAEELVKGPEGLDVQGFTYIDHESALSKSDTCLPEVCDLVCKVTGASKAIVLNCAFRRKPVDLQKDPNWIPMKGDDIDTMLAALPRDKCLVMGKEVESSLEPLRTAHLDYTLKGLRSNIRYVRKDVEEMGRAAVEAEEAVKAGRDVRVPRYAAYSIWRPVKPVKRDGLAVMDWRSLEKDGLDPFEYRVPSNVTESGEFLLEAYNVMPPKNPQKHRWYCMPEQKPNEVLFIKLADTESEKSPGVAGGCGHCAPLIKEQETEEARSSIECRVIAVWD